MELNNGLADSEVPDVDIASVLVTLEAASDGGGPSLLDEAGSLVMRASDLVLRPEDTTLVTTLASQGNQTYAVDVTLEEGTVWAVVRCFQVMTALGDVGRVVVSRPTADDIEQEKVGLSYCAVLSTPMGEEELRAAIEVVEDVRGLDIAPYVVKEEDDATQLAAKRAGSRQG